MIMVYRNQLPALCSKILMIPVDCTCSLQSNVEPKSPQEWNIKTKTPRKTMVVLFMRGTAIFWEKRKLRVLYCTLEAHNTSFWDAGLEKCVLIVLVFCSPVPSIDVTYHHPQPSPSLRFGDTHPRAASTALSCSRSKLGTWCKLRISSTEISLK